MKVKKALKLIKKNCSEETCCIGICPLAYKPKGENYVSCMVSLDNMEEWDIKKINQRFKKWAKKNGKRK